MWYYVVVLNKIMYGREVIFSIFSILCYTYESTSIINVYTYMHMHMCAYTHIPIYTHMHSNMHTHTCTQTFTQMYTHTEDIYI